MTNVKMPRPIGYFECDPETLEPIWGEECICQDNVYDQEETGTVGRKILFSDQAQAYADERVREVLEKAAAEAKRVSDKYGYGYYGSEVDAVDEVSKAICALFPKKSTPAKLG